MRSEPLDSPSSAAYSKPQTPLDDVSQVNHQTEKKSPRRFRLFVAIFVLCGVVCVAVGSVFLLHNQKKDLHANDIITKIQQTPALRVTVNAKRSSMLINGNATAQIYIVPRTESINQNPSTALQFDAIMTQPGEEHDETYILLGNRAYWSISKGDVVIDTGCMSPSQVPPISLMQTSLQNARVVESVMVEDSLSTLDCIGGMWLELSFVGEKFVFCATNTNQLSHAVGEDLDISVEYLIDPTQVPQIHVPLSAEASRSEPLDCPLLDATLPNLSVLDSISRESTGASILKKSSCKCKGPKKPCLFMHGVGESSSGPLLSRDKSGWGDIQKHAPCCSSVKFAQIETIKRGWSDASLHGEFCNTALKVATGNSGNTIGKLILVTHSMGNLIAGAAVANGRCKMSNEVTWVSIAGPMQGSKSANLLERKCNSGGWGNAPIKSILKWVGYCPAQRAYLQLKHQSTVNAATQAKFAAAQNVRSQRVTKVLCAHSPGGLVSKDAVAMKFVSSLSKHDSEDDGVVDFDSCSQGVDSDDFGGSTGSYHYDAAINHLDASFRHGDGWWGSNRKPVKWFECAL